MSTSTVPVPSYLVVARARPFDIGEVAAKASTLQFDRSWNPTTPSDLPGPGELLAAAFAACVIKNVERFGQVLKFDYSEAEVTVELHRSDAPPRFDRVEYQLRIETSESSRRVDLLHRNLQKHGTVFNTLASSSDVSGSIEAWQRNP